MANINQGVGDLPKKSGMWEICPKKIRDVGDSKKSGIRESINDLCIFKINIHFLPLYNKHRSCRKGYYFSARFAHHNVLCIFSLFIVGSYLKGHNC